MAKNKRKKKGNNVPGTKTTSVGGWQDSLLLIPGVQLLLITVLACLAYANTLGVPFYLDDYPSIRENLAIRDLGDFAAIYGFAQQRILGYLTFALNYSWHGYEVAGYHVVNILIHVLASLSVYLLIRQILRIDLVREKAGDELLRWGPLLVALIFALHPLQTQAVTYIVQRLAAMTALFYVSGLALYIMARLAKKRGNQLALFAAAAVLAVMAIMTKQNAVTFPLAVLLIEVFLFGLWGRKLLAVLGIPAAMLALAALLILFTGGSEFFATLNSATQETQIVTRWQYLAIQMGVIWTYFGKFLLPYPLHIEYDILPTSFAVPEVWLLALGHIAVLALAIWLRRRQPLLAFGIVFYYLALSVESSLIPIRDFAFEHRTYLPNLGLCLIAAVLACNFLPKLLSAKSAVAVIVVCLALLMTTTLMRNSLWADPVAFIEHEISVNPQLLRPYGMLGEYYLRQGENEEAITAYLRGLDAIDTSLNRGNNTFLAYYQNLAIALGAVGRVEEGINVLDDYDWSSHPARERSNTHTVRGNLYANLMQLQPARQDFEAALRLNPNNANALLSLGKIQYMQAELTAARETFNTYIELDPDHPYRHEAEQILEVMDQLESHGRQ